MGERFALVSEQQHDVAGLRLLLQHTKARAGTSTAAASCRLLSCIGFYLIGQMFSVEPWAANAADQIHSQ